MLMLAAVIIAIAVIGGALIIANAIDATTLGNIGRHGKP